MFYYCMSTEEIISTEVKDFSPLEIPKKSEKVSSSGRVDINILMSRARKVKEADNRINLVFFGLFVSLLLIVGILLSL